MNLVRLCFSFFGRVNRAKYWIGLGIFFGMMGLGVLVFFWLGPEGVFWNAAVGPWVLLWIVSLLAVVQKRLHDLDISGWWLPGFIIVLLLLDSSLSASFPSIPEDIRRSIISIAMGVGIIWLGSAKGTEGSNRFGPDPIPRPADKGTTNE